MREVVVVVVVVWEGEGEVVWWGHLLDWRPSFGPNFLGIVTK